MYHLVLRFIRFSGRCTVLKLTYKKIVSKLLTISPISGIVSISNLANVKINTILYKAVILWLIGFMDIAG